MMFRKQDREPDFENLKLVLQKKKPPRSVLFEFLIGENKEKLLTGAEYRTNTEFDRVVTTIKAFDSGGYDFAPIIVRGLVFERKSHFVDHALTKSLNEGSVITDRKSFENYTWPEIENCDFSIITKAAEYLSPKAKFIPFSHDGILENVIGIVGYERLCLMLYEDESLVTEIFIEVGKRIQSYFQACLKYPEVGAVILNDDWGFNTHTLISPKALRKYVFPWYKAIVSMTHDYGKYAILHSCGKYDAILEDIIEDMRFDARHSYEDGITSVEKAYEALKGRIAVLGGIDVGFMARSSAEEIYERSIKMLHRSADFGGYALGSGNSIPDYIPNENYIALLRAACDWEKKEGGRV
jgi:uroporphyrinogen decarboxylase